MTAERKPRTNQLPNELWTVRLGTVDYDEALALQQRVHAARAAGEISDVLLLLSHPPIYTRGRRSTDDELPMGADWYAERGIEIREVDRGGKVTYHGPGQVVGYPIVSTALFNRDVPALVGAIEGAIIAALAGERIDARRDEAGRGVWAGSGTQRGKIASIGLHISEGVTTHGLMVNIDNDLQPFSWIKPCGLDDAATSVAELTGESGRARCFSKRLAYELAVNFGLRQRLVSRERLEAALAPAHAQDLVFAS